MATTKGSGGAHAGANFDQTDDSVVVVIGSGAGGGTVAHELTKAGVRVVLLEAGCAPHHRGLREQRVGGLRPDGLAGHAHHRPAPGASPTTSRTCRPGSSRPSAARTTHWAGATPRFHDARVQDPQPTTARSTAPNLLDWPITPGRDRARTTTRPRTRSARTHRHGRRAAAGEQQLHGVRQRRREGSATTSTPPARTARTPSRTTAGRPRSRTASTSRATRTAPSGAPWSARSRGRWPPASSTCGRTRHAVQITHDDAGPRRRGAVPGRRRQPAPAARPGSSAWPATRSRPRGCCCCRASPLFPDGLANSSGQVGRNYMRHTTGSVYAQFEQAGAHVPRRDDGRR